MQRGPQKLTDFEQDMLTEVVNIGAGNASTALSQMVKQKVKIEVPEFNLKMVEETPSIMGKPDEVMSVVLLQILGDAPGVMLLVFPTESALNLAGVLTGRRKQEIKLFDELDRSALREVGNILAGASLAALADFLKLSLLHSIPNIASDMMGAVMNTILADLGKTTEEILVLKVSFAVEKENIEGRVFFLFDPKSTDKILRITRKKVAEKK